MENSNDNPTITKKPKKVRNIDQYFRRHEISEHELVERYALHPAKSQNILYSVKHYMTKYYKPSWLCMKNYTLRRIPFLEWITKYDVKQNLLKDIISGLTIGVIQIPQGMAIALMAGLPAMVGLYVSFFTVLVYALLGTSRQLSLGVYAIVAIMIKDACDEYEGELYPSAEQLKEGLDPNKTHGFLSNDPLEGRVMLSSAITFYVAIIQIGFAIFHIGVLTKYLSDVIVSGFTVAAAFEIVISQIGGLLGIKPKVTPLPVKIIGTLIEIFTIIHKTNIAALVISIITMTFIFLSKKFINEKFKDKLPFPLPIDLVVIVFATLISYLADFKGRWNVGIVGDIKLGLPAPKVPPIHLISICIQPAISIAIVSYAINISMSKLFAKKYKYNLDSNQEAFAYGAGNLLACFFQAFPSCVGLSRCLILDAIGGKTQIYGIISTIIVIIVIQAIGPLFKCLPTAVLASIIVIALVHLCLEVKIIVSIIKRSKFEALSWAATFLGVFIFDVDIGLYIGIGFSLLLIIVRTQRALTSVMGNIPYTDIYESIDLTDEAKEFDGIKIIRYESSVYYANVENFTYKIIKLSEIDVPGTMEQIRKCKARHEKEVHEKEAANSNNGSKWFFWRRLFKRNKKELNINGNADIKEKESDNEKLLLEDKLNEIKSSLHIRHVIIDFSCVNIMDSMGVNAIIALKETFEEIGVELYLVYCKGCVFNVFERNNLRDKFSYDHIFPTTHDAVESILRKLHIEDIRMVSKRKKSLHIKVIDTEDVEFDNENLDDNINNNNSSNNNLNSSPKLIKSYKDKKHVDSFNDLYTIVPKDDPKKVAFRLDPRIAEEEDDPSDSESDHKNHTVYL